MSHSANRSTGNGIVSGPTTHKLRLLVAIASYGEKQLELLKRIIRNYKRMSMEVDVVVVSEARKDLGAGVEVVVGLPSRNPWTLPFAHKPIFAQRADHYDLFIYSEDDIGVTESNIQAFLNATAEVDPQDIAGFVRYEADRSGNWFVNDSWGPYHWVPESVRRRGAYTIAEITNEHSGFYMLTQWQLKRAIASGGFLRGPCRGRYNWPETAATDPYTNCGFRKVICISHLDNFLVHHMSNRYVNLLDVSLAAFREQIQTLLAIEAGTHPASTLCEVESKRWPWRWPKSYYEKPREDLVEMVPDDARTVLSIGCGWGATEARLKQRGIEVTALPLDSVIGAAAERQGITVVYGTWDECMASLKGRQFDCVLMTDLLHLRPDTRHTVAQCSQFVAGGGTLVLRGPNFDRLPWLAQRMLGIGDFVKLRSFDASGFSVDGPRRLAKHVGAAGLRVTRVKWINHAFGRGLLRGRRIPLGSFTARDWIFQARRSSEPPPLWRSA